MRSLLIAAALAAATGVVLGAFGAHALRDLLDPQARAVWQTAVQYHLVHALGTFVVALAISGAHVRRVPAAWAGGLLLAGIVLFCGSLYLLVLTGMRGLGAVTPLGGVAFIAGWLLFAWAAMKPPNR